ncbi:MAG: VapE domain-containing protein [Syntrophomonas sp.]
MDISPSPESGFLRDITGNRRFWPVRVSGNSAKKPWDLTDADID